MSILHSRLWFSLNLVALCWLGFGLLRGGGLPWVTPLARVEVRTVPPGAEILIDGRAAGMSDSFLPVSLAASLARVEISAKKNGYQDARTTVEVRPDKVPLVVFRLEEKSSHLEVHSDDGRPFELKLGPEHALKADSKSLQLEPGLYEVWGVREGQSSAHKLVNLKPGQSEDLHLSWAQTPGPAPPRPALGIQEEASLK